MGPLRWSRGATWTFLRLALKQIPFRLGRESAKGSSMWLNAVSKCQCKIIMNRTGVFLTEKSSNRFWVNRNKLGKDNMWTLENNSEIFFLRVK